MFRLLKYKKVQNEIKKMADVLSFQPCGNRKFLLTEAFTSLYIYQLRLTIKEKELYLKKKEKESE